jgi:hypothetical protein
MADDDLAEYIPILRARLDCGSLIGLGPWAKDDWYITDVAAEARFLLREVDQFAALSPVERSNEARDRRAVAWRLRNLRDGLAEWGRRTSGA